MERNSSIDTKLGGISSGVLLCSMGDCSFKHFKIIGSKDFECFHHKEMINIEGMDILNTLI